MNKKKPGRAQVKRHIKDDDRVFVAPDGGYLPETNDHKIMWPRIVKMIGERGAWYSTLRAACSSNKDYVAYLIGDLGALKCPEVDRRLGLDAS